AVFADEGAEDAAPQRRRPGRGVVPLLEQAIDLFEWTDEQAAAALDTTPETVRAWLDRDEPMPLPQRISVTALLAGDAAAAAGGQPALADLASELARGERQRGY